MSIEITTWIRAYFALFDHLRESRGVVETNPGSPDNERWPISTGADVVMIAAFVDPVARTCDQFGTARRWSQACGAIDPAALREPALAYPENRAFWRAVASTFVDLHAANVPLPAGERWQSLFDRLGELARYRNKGPSGDVPFGPFPALETYSDLYRAQIKYLFDKRGFDLMDAPPGHTFGGSGMKIPRATNADARLLTSYWSNVFANAKKVQGSDNVGEKWRAIAADVERLAAADKPNEVYAKNNELFRELPNVSSKITESEEKRSEGELFLESLKDSLANLPQNLGKAVDYVAGHVSDAAKATGRAVGGVVNQAAKGAFTGLGVPLVLGGVGLATLFLLTRRGDNRSERPNAEEE